VIRLEETRSAIAQALLQVMPIRSAVEAAQVLELQPLEQMMMMMREPRWMAAVSLLLWVVQLEVLQSWAQPRDLPLESMRSRGASRALILWFLRLVPR
jgi:hypothetical protein